MAVFKRKIIVLVLVSVVLSLGLGMGMLQSQGSDGVVSAVAQDSGTTVNVSAKSNIYASGRDKIPEFSGGGGVMPKEVELGDANEVRIISATGNIESGAGGNGPGGIKGGQTSIKPYKGISGITHENRTFFLAGVFLSDSGPPESAPERMDFTNNDDFKSLSPKIGQVFYIGDGKTDSGQVQKFKVPDGATKLYLGIPDAFAFGGEPGYYDDNKGNLTVTYKLLKKDSGSSSLPGFGLTIAIIGVIGASYILMRRE